MPPAQSINVRVKFDPRTALTTDQVCDTGRHARLLFCHPFFFPPVHGGDGKGPYQSWCLFKFWPQPISLRKRDRGRRRLDLFYQVAGSNANRAGRPLFREDGSIEMDCTSIAPIDSFESADYPRDWLEATMVLILLPCWLCLYFIYF